MIRTAGSLCGAVAAAARIGSWSFPGNGASAAASSPGTAGSGTRSTAPSRISTSRKLARCRASTTRRMPRPPTPPSARSASTWTWRRAILDFPGCPSPGAHRRVDGVTYVNDSEGDQRRCRRPRLSSLREHLLDCRRPAQRGRTGRGRPCSTGSAARFLIGEAEEAFAGALRARCRSPAAARSTEHSRPRRSADADRSSGRSCCCRRPARRSISSRISRRAASLSARWWRRSGMSITFARTDTSLLGRWWWTVDRWTVAVDPADRRSRHRCLRWRHHRRSPSACNSMPSTSRAARRPTSRRRWRDAGDLATVAEGRAADRPDHAVRLFMLTIATLFVGDEIRARPGGSTSAASVQPSEFLKPAFAVVSAWP